MQTTETDLKNIFSQNAFTFYSTRYHAYVIAYNQNLSPFQLMFWGFHELGHIVLGHLSGSNDKAKQEQAANSFAAFFISYIKRLL